MPPPSPSPSTSASHASANASADAERQHLLSVLSSFSSYLPYSLAANNIRRRTYHALPRAHRALLAQVGEELPLPSVQLHGSDNAEGSVRTTTQGTGTRGVKARLDEIDDRIRRNAAFLEDIISEGRGFLGMEGGGGEDDDDDDEAETYDAASRNANGNATHAGPSRTSSSSSSSSPLPPSPPHRRSLPLQPPKDLDKVRSTLKQLARDWSASGAAERAAAYAPVLAALEALFPAASISPPRHATRVLFPGCGAGRLPWEAAMRGFSAQGNEFSMHMLLASQLVLNRTRAVREHAIYPWVHSMSNWPSAGDALEEVRIPDVDPNELTRRAEAQAEAAAAAAAIAAAEADADADADRAEGTQAPPSPSPDFSMVAGDFLSVYSVPAERYAFHAVCTVFFLDTARNPLRYIEVINHVLPVGGYWVNLGPLLWHFEGQGPGRGRGRAEGEGGAQGEGEGEGEGAQGGYEGKSGAQGEGEEESSSRGEQSPTHDASSSPPPSEGSLELTLSEVLSLLPLLGFELVRPAERLPRQRYTGAGGSMLVYEYEAAFWVCRKVRGVKGESE